MIPPKLPSVIGARPALWPERLRELQSDAVLLGDLNLDFDETNVMRDQIGFFSVGHDLPSPDDNRTAGSGGISGYDYGVFSFTDLFAAALHGVRYDDLSAARQNEIIAAIEDVITALSVIARRHGIMVQPEPKSCEQALADAPAGSRLELTADGQIWPL